MSLLHVVLRVLYAPLSQQSDRGKAGNNALHEKRHAICPVCTAGGLSPAPLTAWGRLQRLALFADNDGPKSVRRGCTQRYFFLVSIDFKSAKGL